MKMFRIKFQRNRNINEKFEFWGVKGEGGLGVLRFKKKLKNFIQKNFILDPTPKMSTF